MESARSAGGVVAALTLLMPAGARAFVFPIACVVAGAAASAINGELAGEGWLFFFTVDSLIVWAAATVSFGVAWWLRRHHALS